MESNIKFYNLFHKKSAISDKLINKKNFTYRIVLSILDKYVTDRSGLKILDYGCGVGTISLYLASKGNKVTGIDISNRAINIAQQSALKLGLSKSTVFYSSVKGKNKIRNQKFDRIILIEVIEHVKNDVKMVRYLSQHLNKGGYLIISTPSKNAPLYKWGFAGNFDKRVGHLRRYDTETLSKILKDEKLKIVYTTKTEGVIRNTLYLFNTFGKLVRFIRGPISDLVTYIDNFTIPIFGESDIFMISKKIK